uniref:(California timema) hypothetical protein n=1 Tax=Timema californicum TaxID=61474 RepID=A0A7R9P3B8_TIMCA|nr:unnamed protein product [Timema californicum]
MASTIKVGWPIMDELKPLEQNTLEIRTKSIEQTLIPLVKQASHPGRNSNTDLSVTCKTDESDYFVCVATSAMNGGRASMVAKLADTTEWQYTCPKALPLTPFTMRNKGAARLSARATKI